MGMDQLLKSHSSNDREDTTFMAQLKFRVAICGGGIGGLTLAATLGKYSRDLQVDVYEAAAEFVEIGAGISVWRRTWKIMQLLGLDVALGKMAIRPPEEKSRSGFVFRKGDQAEEGVSFYQMVAPYGSITLHRADMLKVLVDGLPQTTKAHFSKRLVGYREEPSGAITLQFSDGTEAETDVLVGADGIRSATRATMYRRASERADPDQREKLLGFVEPTWTGTLAYRALVDTEHLTTAHPSHRAATTPLIYFGKDKHVVSYPISRGRLVNLIGFVTVPGGEGTRFIGPSVQDVPKREMLDHFEGWEPEIQSLMECVDKPSRWAISTVRGLPFSVAGRAALLGDSAHAMMTHQGAGAGQAIEDALILGRILAHPKVTLHNVAAALEIYQAVRLPFGSNVVERSRMTGFVYEFNHPDHDVAKDGFSLDALKALGQEVYQQWSWQWDSVPEEEWIQAEMRLESLFSADESAILDARL